MALQAFLSVGLSFADVGIFENTLLKSQRRFYLPQEPLGNALKKFWAENGLPESLCVSSRYLEKILDSKLGGTVAQVVTAGFETWPILRQPVLPARFDLKPYRQEPLASQELIFGLSERIDSSGKVLNPVEMTELEFINSKLKLMTVKRVCVNLLFSQKNPKHQKQVADYFREQGFEVFAADRSQSSVDEMPAWRKNVINACLSGAFTDHCEEIKKSFAETPVELHFLNHQGEKFLADRNQIAGSLFSWAWNLRKLSEGTHAHVLCLGLENWFLLSNQTPSSHWESAWGLIETLTPKIHKLQAQPTLELNQGFWGGVQFSTNELGFEPGPTCFGRAQKLTAFDLLNDKFNLQVGQINPQGIKRFKDQLTAMNKNIPELSDMTAPKLTQALIDQLVSKIAIEVQFKTASGKIFVTGFFAEALLPLIQKKCPELSFSLDPQFADQELMALAQVEGTSV